MNWPNFGSFLPSSPRFAAAAAAAASTPRWFGLTPAQQAPAPSQVSPQVPALQVSTPALQAPAPQPPILAPPQPPILAPRKRKISAIEKNAEPVATEPVAASEPTIASKIVRHGYDGSQFTTLKRNIFTQLLNKIKSHPIFLRCSKEAGFDDIITQFIFDTLPRGVDSNLAFLKNQGDINELAAYICRKFLALSVNYPGLGFEQTQAIPNQVLIDLIANRNTELTPTMVKKCVRNPRPGNQFECDLTSIPTSRTTPLQTSLTGEFISATRDLRESPFPCYSIGNYLYSIGPMILDPRGDHIGRNLVMIRVLNYKNHIYPQGNYFWAYPSSSEGGLSRTLFKLPGGVTGTTLIKGTEYYSLSEIAALESAINEFSMMAQSILPPTIISDYETFVCFLGNMPHLQKLDIARYLPTITVSNRYCYQFDMTNPPAVNLFDSKSVDSIQKEKNKRTKSATFFSHIFDNGFDGNYQINGYNFAPTNPDDFTFTAIVDRLQKRGVKFDWLSKVGQLQPVCSFSCIHIDPAPPRGTSFEWLIKNWNLTHNVQGIEIFSGHPHPTVCTLTGALAYVVGHRGNSFLKDMVPSSVLTFLPPLPITRLSTYSNQPGDLEVALATSKTRSRKEYNKSTRVFDTRLLEGPQGTVVLPRRVTSIIEKIADFFEWSYQTQTSDPFLEKLKVCLLTFLDITPQDRPSLSRGNFSTFFTERVKRTGSIGLKNLLSIQTATTYVRMLAADTLQTYLGVQTIPDAQTSFEAVMPPRLLVRVSWLGKTHNYVPIARSDGTVAFQYNNPDDAVIISNIFNNSHTFDPYIIEARRDAKSFSEGDLGNMQFNRGSAGRGVFDPSIPVVVTNKTMLFRVIIYNDTTNNPDDVTGSESVKFGALEVIVSISSTAVLNKTGRTLHFGTDVQFSVVSITACRHTRGPDGDDHFEKFQTFHGTNADIESVGIWGTNKLGDYAATVMGYDQYHPEISEFLRSLLTIDAHNNSVSVSPYNTPEHWIMKVFAPVLKNDANGQRLRADIFEKWQWETTIASMYGANQTDHDIVLLAGQIKNMGNVLRLAANLFFSDQEIEADEADDAESVVDPDNVSSYGSVQSSDVNWFLREGDLAPQNDVEDQTPMGLKTPRSRENSDDEGSELGDENWMGPDDLEKKTKPTQYRIDGGRRKPRVHKTTQKYKRYRLTNKQKQKSTNANNKNKNKNKNIKTIKNNKRLGSNKSKPKPKSKSKLKCKRRMNMNTVTRRR
jgi:hypothetical protein